MRFLIYYLVMIIKPTLKDKILLLFAILYSILILILSLVKLENIEVIELESSDKIYHTICYAILTITWLTYFKFKIQFVKENLILASLIITYGIVIEYLQLNLTSYRQFDWWDVMANSTGVLIGFVISKLYHILFNNKKI